MADKTFTELCRLICSEDEWTSRAACFEWERRFPSVVLTVGMVDYMRTM